MARGEAADAADHEEDGEGDDEQRSPKLLACRQPRPISFQHLFFRVLRNAQDRKNVPPVERSLRFYCEGLGFERAERYDLDESMFDGLARALEVDAPAVDEVIDERPRQIVTLPRSSTAAINGGLRVAQYVMSSSTRSQ